MTSFFKENEPHTLKPIRQGTPASSSPCPGHVDLPRLGIHPEPQSPTLSDAPRSSPCPTSLFRLSLVFSLRFLPLLSPTRPKPDPLVAVCHFSRTFYHFSRTFGTKEEQLEADGLAAAQRTAQTASFRERQGEMGMPFAGLWQTRVKAHCLRVEGTWGNTKFTQHLMEHYWAVLHSSAWRECAFFPPQTTWLHWPHLLPVHFSIFGDFTLWCEGFQGFNIWVLVFFFLQRHRKVWPGIIKLKVTYLSHAESSLCTLGTSPDSLHSEAEGHWFQDSPGRPQSTDAQSLM